MKGVWLPEQGEELSAAEKGILEVAVVERAAVVLADHWTESALLWQVMVAEWTAGVEVIAAAAVLEDQLAKRAWPMASSCQH